MADTILVTGGSGRLGRVVAAGLQRRGADVRVLTRQLRAGSGVAQVPGDFDDPESLARALQGVGRLFLLSPISPRLAEQQIAVLQAAQAAGVQRIVKLSGSDWTLQPPGRSVSGDQHRRVEVALAGSGIAHAVLRPNAWMQVALGRLADEVRSGVLRNGFGDAPVSFIDLRDIADVAVQLLLADALPDHPLVLTGPESLSLPQIASLASALQGQAVVVHALSPEAQAQAALQAGLPEFVRRAHAEFGALIRSGLAADTTPTVQQLLGCAPRTLAAWLGEKLAA